MRLSEKKQSALYEAIASEIMDVRLTLQRQIQLPAKQDVVIAQSVSKIWRKVFKVLNLRGTP